MRKTLLLTFILVVLAVVATAAPVSNMPVIRIQPGGDTLRCWVSGDEFFHRLHDAEGYTIVQNVKTGEYVYATVEDGLLVPTVFVPGKVDPAQVGLVPNLMPSAQELRRLHSLWDIPEVYRVPEPKTAGENHGVLNNVVIFIRFHDEAVCTSSPFDSIRAMFNDSTAGAMSMYNYFKSSSYNNIRIPTVFCPTPTDSVVLSYQDIYDRSYYMPYSATNPNGYVDFDARRVREFSLLERAVNWVNANCPVDTNLNLDMNADGKVDNICFVVSGNHTDWSTLLWPHKWDLYDRYVYINGKRVYTFNLQLEGSGSHYFSVSTFCHEMSHALGCPDMYHYYNYTNVSPGGSWDLMCDNQNPPEQVTSLYKLKYLNWFDSIPEITEQGSYTLQSLATGPNRACKIASGAPHQWYILEYRNLSDTYDASIPNRGLLIWRYNDSPMADNVDFNNVDTLHELWLFRPNSTDDTTSGRVSAAAFGVAGRNTFSAAWGDQATASNPYPYLCDGTADTSFKLTDIQVSSDYQSVSFTFTPYVQGCTTVDHFPEVMDFEWGDLGCWEFVSANSVNAAEAGVIEEAHSGNQWFYPYEGQYQFRFSSYNYASDYNQFLISPQLQPSNPLHLVFHYRKEQFPNEQFCVKYSTSGNDTADFTHTIATFMVNTSGWQTCSIVVPEEAEYVAIHYQSHFRFRLYLDDFRLTDTLQNAVIRDTTYIYHYDTVYYDVTDTIVVTLYDTILVTPNYYQVTIFSNDTDKGSVSGNGLFPKGTVLEIAALPKEGCYFDYWSDGSEDNPRKITVDGDLQLEAVFGAGETPLTERRKTTYIHDTIHIQDTIRLPNRVHDTVYRYVHAPLEYDTTTYYTLTVLSSDTAKGLAVGSGIFPRGSMVELGALALPDYRLWHWEDLSHDNPRTVRVTGDMTLMAIFVGDDLEAEEPTEEYLQVYVQGNTIVVESALEEPVVVYNVLGQPVCRSAADRNKVRFTSLRQGLYLVKVGDRPARKVVVVGRE